MYIEYHQHEYTIHSMHVNVTANLNVKAQFCTSLLSPFHT